jgi:hypothetical protein
MTFSDGFLAQDRVIVEVDNVECPAAGVGGEQTPILLVNLEVVERSRGSLREDRCLG